MNEPTTDKPAHTPEPGTKCCKTTRPTSRYETFYPSQCTRKAVTIEGGKPYCKVHTPSTRKAKMDAEMAKQEAHWDAKIKARERTEACVNACKGIDDPAKAIEQARKALESAERALKSARRFLPTHGTWAENGIDSYESAQSKIAVALSLLGAKDGMEGL